MLMVQLTHFGLEWKANYWILLKPFEREWAIILLVCLDGSWSHLIGLFVQFQFQKRNWQARQGQVALGYHDRTQVIGKTEIRNLILISNWVSWIGQDCCVRSRELTHGLKVSACIFYYNELSLNPANIWHSKLHVKSQRTGCADYIN